MGNLNSRFKNDNPSKQITIKEYDEKLKEMNFRYFKTLNNASDNDTLF